MIFRTIIVYSIRSMRKYKVTKLIINLKTYFSLKAIIICIHISNYWWCTNSLLIMIWACSCFLSSLEMFTYGNGMWSKCTPSSFFPTELQSTLYEVFVNTVSFTLALLMLNVLCYLPKYTHLYISQYLFYNQHPSSFCQRHFTLYYE